MKRNTLILYIVFLFFMLGLLFTSLYVDELVANSRLDKMISLAQNAYLFKYLSFFGLILLVVDFSLNFLTIRQLHKDKEAMQLEMNTLKAKLFDLQEAEKKAVVTKKEEEK